jgi:hypothetical protein
MNSSTFCSLFLGLILISQSPLSANARGLLGVVGGGLVDELCNDMDDKIACHNILGSNPEAMKAKNYKELSKTILTMAINKAIEGQNFIKGLAAATKSLALTGCADFSYDNLVGDFKLTLGEITTEPYKIVSYALESIEYDVESCNNDNPQVTALNKEMLLFGQMAYYATDGEF